MIEEQNNLLKTQKVFLKDEAHNKLLIGSEILFKAVSSTMGPSGHSVIIDNERGAPTITKDGVTVAKAINLKDKLEAIGAELMKEIASKTNDLAGDGTTTGTVLGYALLYEGIKQITAGCSSINIRKGMDLAAQEVIKFLKSNCISVRNSKDIINVGTISANGDREIGELISEAIEKVGRDGIITIEPAKSVHTHLDIVEGMQLENGYVSPFFITNSEKSSCELEDAYVLMTSNKISSLSEIMKVLEQVAKAEKPLLLIADEVEGDALHTLIVNKMKGVLKVCAIKAPSYGENRADILNDLSTLIGGEVFGATNETSLKNATLQQLGKAKKIIVGRRSCIIVGDPSNKERHEKTQERIMSLRNALENDKTLDELRISKYKQRLAKLSGGIAVIKVGGSTEVEIFEKKDRVEDAVNATMAAAQEGIVPGGGAALFYASKSLKTMLKTNKFKINNEDIIAGIKIVANACEWPLKVIVTNTGRSAEVVMNELAKQFTVIPNFRIGYDAVNDKFSDLIDEGIIDPMKVERAAIQNSISVVSLMLTCNAVITNDN